MAGRKSRSSRVRDLLEELDPSTIARYTEYIDSIAPKDDWGVAKRWIFAFCSIHTSWQSNVNAFEAIVPLGPDASQEDIVEALRGSRAGLHAVKGRNIKEFLDRFNNNPAEFSFTNTYAAKAQRDVLASKLNGIGLAKTSFACELINPEARVVCLDTHALRWITGDTTLNGKMGPARYRAIELAWLSETAKLGYSPVAARHAVWDRVQNRPDMRYWSYVLES